MGDEGLTAAIYDFVKQLSDATEQAERKPNLQLFQARCHAQAF